MKNPIKFKRAIILFFMVSGMALLHSCAVSRPYNFNPVTITEIVQMSKDKVPSNTIINEIKESHTAYTIKASEYAKLQKAGVADSVIDYMQKTHLDLIRHNEQLQNSYYWGPGYGYYWNGPGYGWPYRYGYWGWNIGPTFIFRGGGGHFYGGGYHGGVHRGSHGGGHARR